MKRYLAVSSVCAALLCGCSGLSSFDIQVSPTQELKNVYGYFPSLEVDVIGASDEDAIRLKSYPLDKYFEKNNPIRTYFEPVTFHFSEEDLSNKTIYGSSDIFKQWEEKGATYIILIANIPYGDPDSKDSDPRKFMYRIPDGFMSSHPDLYIKVGGTGLIKTTSIGAKDSRPETPIDSDLLPEEIDLKCTSEKAKKDMKCTKLPKVTVVGSDK